MMYTNGFEELLEASPALRLEVETNEGRMVTHQPYVDSTAKEFAAWGKVEKAERALYEIGKQGACPECFMERSATGACECSTPTTRELAVMLDGETYFATVKASTDLEEKATITGMVAARFGTAAAQRFSYSPA
jgi:hypothetical protein